MLVVAATAGLAWVAGCGDGATEPPPPDPPRPTTVAVTPATAELTALEATVQLRAEVRDQNGQVMTGATVTWASGSAAVATVDPTGLVTAAGNGTATITATAGSASGSATVTVAQEVNTVTVTPAGDTLVAGDTLRLAAEATDANGHPVAEVEFSWASSDTLVATVDAAGLATAVGAGQAEVTAMAAGITGRAELTVLAPAPTTVAVTPDTVALMALGQTAQLTAEVRDQAGRVMVDVPVFWASADTTIAAVDAAGLVTAVGGGATTITATVGRGTWGEAVVTVMQSAGSVIVSPSAETVALGDTLRLVAQALDANGHVVEDAEFSWSSSDGSVARVDGSGLVTGIAEGTATITAAAGSAGGTAEITVANPDRAALVALYNATDGLNWVNNDNWLTDARLGDWYGVDTDGSGRVVRVDLFGRRDPVSREWVPHGLTGPIPPELGDLANLEVLDLSTNDLSGPIPAELGNLSNLTALRLGKNYLTSPIPPELGNLHKLRDLNLSQADLGGPIPPELGNLSQLLWLNLSTNAFRGSIPLELTRIPGLRRLRLGTNNLTGTIPPEIADLAELEYLSLFRNELEGAIPSDLGNLPQLRTLLLSENRLSGPIPPELGTLPNLEWLWLQKNNLSGLLPPELLQLNRIRILRFADNATLCAPGTAPFVDWIEGIQKTEGPFCNESDIAILESLYAAAGGASWTNSDNWLGGAALAEWYGIETDSLGRVQVMDLGHNGLAGRIPESLGGLTTMTKLQISGNAVSGRLPLLLVRLPLEALRYADTSLCAPTDESFQEWLNAIPSHEGTGVECAPPSDRDVLVSLYDATGGPKWTNSGNWLTDAPLGEWYGVTTQTDGSVLSLELQYNNLSGPIPPELGNLANLSWLDLGANRLSGPIPAELGTLRSLNQLRLAGNNLSGPIPPELGTLWSLNQLRLAGNNLSGPIPPELGNLSRLRRGRFQDNTLSGPIPPELGNLANLLWLGFQNNQLSGPIPPELGNLANLKWLELEDNQLSGPIPPELGNLSSLLELRLQHNNLSGPIPPELGDLPSITSLRLDYNALNGPLPPRLGDLSTLEVFELSNNDVTGSVPSEFGRMASLRQLSITNNAGMSGPLPAGLTDLAELEALLADGTSLCAPTDADFQVWLEGVYKRRIAPCTEGSPPMAYLTQATQSREFPVPLVAGERALLRVFPTTGRATSTGIPVVQARFFVNGRETHVENIPGKSDRIPTEVDESSLSKSANAEIPAEVIQPGLEMVIEVDPDGALDPALGVAKRIPENGRLAVEVRELPLFDLTLIPFIWSQNPDNSIVDLIREMAADPENHPMLQPTRTLLPVGDLDITAHEPVLTSMAVGYQILNQTEAIRVMEGGSGHYMGMLAAYSGRGGGGVAMNPGRSSFSLPRPSTMAHELGHNMKLGHAPCGGPRGDPSFPSPDGSIGTWGYDFRDGGKLVWPSTPDLMSYCDPSWISDYYFTNALRYRLFDEGAPTGANVRARSLLLWGGVNADGVPYLEPAFVLDAPPALPDSAGEYRLTGQTADGRQLFSLSFTMSEMADGDGHSSFAFVLPVQPEWEGDLAGITLTGPDGSATLDEGSNLPMAILRNPRTGQVRGILRNLPPAAQVASDARGSIAEPDLEVLFSGGIPEGAAWRR